MDVSWRNHAQHHGSESDHFAFYFLGGGLRKIACLCFVASSISVVACKTFFSFCAGTEALFADLCHFPVLAIQVKCLQNRVAICVRSYMLAKVKVCLQIAFTLIVFPCLLLAYTGQAAYIISNKTHVADAFYRSIPGPHDYDIIQSYWLLNLRRSCQCALLGAHWQHSAQHV